MSFERLVSKLTKENLWMFILKELSIKPTYAYQLAKILKRKYKIDSARVTTYVVLYKMERERLIQPEKKSRLISRPGRKYYGITEKGSKLLGDGKAFLQETLQKLQLQTDEASENDDAYSL